MRAKHVHFKVFADGYQPLTTEVALAPDDYLATDHWRHQRESLVTMLQELDDAEDGKEQYTAHFDFVLNKANKEGYAILAEQIPYF